jgi:TetR/AcrR family transcriptional regulator
MDNASQLRVAATRLFAGQGFGATSLQAISDEVGVTKQTLLYHFPSKEELRRAVLDAVFEHWRERLPRILEAVTSGERRFQALTEELLRFFESDRDRARLLLRELLDNPEDMRRLIAENLRPWVLLIAQYVREGQRLGMIHEDVDPEVYVLHVITLVVANVASDGVLAAALGRQGDTRSRELTELTRLTHTALFTGSQPSRRRAQPQS